jgi:hypothetical protein
MLTGTPVAPEVYWASPFTCCRGCTDVASPRAQGFVCGPPYLPIIGAKGSFNGGAAIWLLTDETPGERVAETKYDARRVKRSPAAGPE